jgi:hypothetical protein
MGIGIFLSGKIPMKPGGKYRKIDFLEVGFQRIGVAGAGHALTE